MMQTAFARQCNPLKFQTRPFLLLSIAVRSLPSPTCKIPIWERRLLSSVAFVSHTGATSSFVLPLLLVRPLSCSHESFSLACVASGRPCVPHRQVLLLLRLLFDQNHELVRGCDEGRLRGSRR
jgi:hypothetical protein